MYLARLLRMSDEYPHTSTLVHALCAWKRAGQTRALQRARLQAAVRDDLGQAGILGDERQRGVAAVLCQRQVAAAGFEHGEHGNDGVDAGFQQQADRRAQARA